jgi:hypothetical protein
MLGRLRRKVQPKTPRVTFASNILGALWVSVLDPERSRRAVNIIVLVRGQSQNNHTASTGNIERELSCSGTEENPNHITSWNAAAASP